MKALAFDMTFVLMVVIREEQEEGAVAGRELGPVGGRPGPGAGETAAETRADPARRGSQGSRRAEPRPRLVGSGRP